MNVYFDFEATQFSERVISIGATCERGEFGCFVSSFADRITPFITELTGITKEMVKGAPTAEEAFSDLRDWLNEICDDDFISYHCYGNSDKIFLYNTARKVENQEIANFIRELADALLDDSLIVTHYLEISSIGVYKALKRFDPDIPAQDHDAVNDAILLSRLMGYMEDNYSINPALYIVVKKSTSSKKKKKKTDERKFQIIVTHTKDTKAKQKTFFNYGTATQWMYNKIKKKCPDAKMNTIFKHIVKAVDENIPYADWAWKKEYI
jgi:DNA polymerase III alpha subunit (gram-positive type)